MPLIANGIQTEVGLYYICHDCDDYKDDTNNGGNPSQSLIGLFTTLVAKISICPTGDGAGHFTLTMLHQDSNCQENAHGQQKDHHNDLKYSHCYLRIYRGLPNNTYCKHLCRI